MRDHRPAIMDKDSRARFIVPVELILFNSIKGDMISQVSSFVDNTIHRTRSFDACQEVFSNVCKLAGNLRILFTHTSSSTLSLSQLDSENHNSPTTGSYAVADLSVWASSSFLFGARLMKHTHPFNFSNMSKFVARLLHRRPERIQSFSLATVLLRSFNKTCLHENPPTQKSGLNQVAAVGEQGLCEVERPGCKGCLFPEVKTTMKAVEPITGIEFPMVLEGVLCGQSKPSIASEVLVGTGSRIMKIIRIKSLQVYAFGFYVHPSSLCEKLRPKYSCTSELDKRHEFLQDILREDIGMTVRLVINCNGVKIGSVRDAFEKSLRARLLKTNPDTNFDCIKTFGSFFTNDIPISAGTIVEFRRTSDGKLITEVEGKQIGAVDSKELCTAFFDMYIGDGPVSEQTKQEIGRNVANIISKC